MWLLQNNLPAIVVVVVVVFHAKQSMALCRKNSGFLTVAVTYQSSVLREMV